MTTELKLLVFAAFIGLLHVLLAAGAATKQRGTKWNLSSREKSYPALQGAAGRLERAQKNFFETFPLFVAVVVALRFGDISNALTVTACWLYVVARVLYLPIYAAGITVVRTLIWTVSLLGIILLFVQAFLAMAMI